MLHLDVQCLGVVSWNSCR